MNCESIPKIPARSGTLIFILEIAVPLLSFGGALVAFLASESGSSIDIRYFAAGCVISSFILAYLAWIRPQKDIVALSTPIYAVLFFIVPSDVAVTLILEFLYAVSLTILLIRLKLRFGPAVLQDAGGKILLAEPLKTYCESLAVGVSHIPGRTTHLAAIGFIRFSLGDYREVIRIADTAKADPETGILYPALATAFAIIREQAELLDTSSRQPELFMDFREADIPFLAKNNHAAEKSTGARYELALDNALLLLFAAAWNASDADRHLLLSGEEFALRLIAD